MRLFSHSWKILSALSIAALLSGCLGSDDPAPTTLGGTAATGAPIVAGTVNVKCAGGSALSDVTDTNGVWQVTISGQTLPCAVEVSGGNLPAGQAFHSVALQLGTVNITPLTDLVVANLAGQAPATWFSGLNAGAIQQLNTAAVNTALGNLRTALNLTALNSVDPMTVSFTAAAGNSMDNMLEALGTAFADYQALLQEAFNRTNFSSYAAQFQAAFSNAYSALPTTGGSGGGTGGGSGGSTTCTGAAVSMTYFGGTNGGPHTDAQELCIAASTTSLAFSGKTLSSPTQNTVVQAPYSAYAFTDTAARYEVIFNAGALYEINVSSLDGNTFYGQFTPTAGSGGGGGGGAGTSTLTVAVSINGVASPAAGVVIQNVPAPGSQTEFCNALQNDTTFTNIGTAAGGSLTINSCTYANNTGTISATLNITTPIALTVPYTVTYTYN